MWTEKIVDRESQQKLYVQIHSIVKEKIEKRDWPNNTQIPTEDELCKTYQVSKATVRMAISELVRTGYLKKRQGKGTFVTSAVPDLGIAMKTRLTENILGEGVIAKKEVIERGVKGMSGDIRSILLFNGKDDENSDLFYILRRRLVDGEPAYLEESFVPLAVFPGIQHEDVCEKPFYDLIQEKSIRKIFKVVQTIEVSEITAEAASLLRVYESTPALLLHRLLIGSDARPIAYTRLLGTGKKYKIQTEFERIK